MKGLIRHLLDNAADHDALIKILWTPWTCVWSPRLSTNWHLMVGSTGFPRAQRVDGPRCGL
jgi:hypothetical protein